MTTYFMFGKYSPEAIGEISVDRTNMAAELIKESGGEVKAMYALLGGYDLVFIVDLPSVEQAMKVSISIKRFAPSSASSAS